MEFRADGLKQISCVFVQLLRKRKTLVCKACATYKNVSFTLQRKFALSLSKGNINERRNSLLIIFIEQILRRNPIGN